MISLPESAYQSTNYYAKIRCDAQWRWPEREKPLDNYDLFYVWSGSGEVMVNDHVYQVEKGSCFLFRPGDYTSATHDQQHPLVITYVHFNLDRSAEHVPKMYRRITDCTDMEIALSRYVRLRLSSLYGAQEEANLILKQMMIYLLRLDQFELASTPHVSMDLQDRLLEVANYVREHPHVWFRVSELASRAQLSPRYFAEKFKLLMGVTVQDYEIRCRLERAEFLLRYGGMTVSETADALGYKDVYYFSKQFKQHFGRNASQMR
jgi:AraC family transcriptional regulator of arabinose operon